MALLSTYINARTNDYELLNGKVVIANELVTEAYTRIVTPINTYMLDPTFGSELAGWINRRVRISSEDVTNSVKEALKPLVEQNRALGISVTVNSIALGYVNFSVAITDTDNSIYRFTVPLRTESQT